MVKQTATHWQTVLGIVAIILCVLSESQVGGTVGDIVTIKTENGEVLGPYIVKEIHSHYEGSGEALALTADEELEGSGNGVYDALYDDTETGDDLHLAIEEEQPVPYVVDDSNSEGIDAIAIDEQPVLNPNEQTLPRIMIANITNKVEFEPVPAPAEVPATTRGSIPVITTKQTVITKQPTTRTTREVEPTMPVTADPACHEKCVRKLHESFQFTASPNVTVVATGDSMQFTCQVAETLEGNMQTVELRWLFLGDDSPHGECSLEEESEQYVRLCSDLPEVDSVRDTNSTHLTYTLTLKHLTRANTGHVICQAVAHCCGNVIQQDGRHYLRVWYADYTTELLVLAAAAVGLTLILVAGLLYQRKREANAKHNYMQVVVVHEANRNAANQKRTVQQLPIDDQFLDEDSFDEESN